MSDVPKLATAFFDWATNSPVLKAAKNARRNAALKSEILKVEVQMLGSILTKPIKMLMVIGLLLSCLGNFFLCPLRAFFIKKLLLVGSILLTFWKKVIPARFFEMCEADTFRDISIVT